MKKKQRKAHRRGPNLTDAAIETIVKILDGWTGPLSWSMLIDIIEERIYVRYTRQCLSKHRRIYNAYRIKKEGLREQPVGRKRAVSAELQAAIDTMARLESEVKRLRSENQGLLEQFAVWAYNARIRNVDEKVLNAPLPSISRD